ncbi:MAG: Cobalt transporter subunit (CbtA) [Cenarchaeum symbiont of Oopsacas minuta]|nr:Cobalt transporter subunit (CbtA) [Cenarchaeum symbiont of Oopsacas minuta]
MKFLAFICVILVSGIVAGTIQGIANFVLVEPVLDRAISLENMALFDSGDVQNTVEFRLEHEAYRTWQKGGQIIASAILGMSFGSLFGLIYAYVKKSLPSSDTIKKSLILAAIMWLVLFAIPFVKYPSNPPTVGDPATVGERTMFYLGLITVSGLLMLGTCYILKFLHGNKKFLALAGCACIMGVTLILFPEPADTTNVPKDLLYDFRLASAISVTSFWITIPFVLGGLWRKFIPDVRDDFIE